MNETMINKKKYRLFTICLLIILLTEPACTSPWRMLTTGRPTVTHTKLFPSKTISKAEKSTAVFIENEKNELRTTKPSKNKLWADSTEHGNKYLQRQGFAAKTSSMDKVPNQQTNKIDI